jgi:hypothetical protein
MLEYNKNNYKFTYIYMYIPGISDQITDAEEACRSSEISINLIIIIVFGISIKAALSIVGKIQFFFLLRTHRNITIFF